MYQYREREQHITEQKTRRVIETLWLSYYNDTLFANGVITEAERNRMRLRIQGRAADSHTR